MTHILDSESDVWEELGIPYDPALSLLSAFIHRLRRDLAHPVYKYEAARWLEEECPTWFRLFPETYPDTNLASDQYIPNYRARLQRLPVRRWFRVQDVAHLYTDRRLLLGDLAYGVKCGLLARRGLPGTGRGGERRPGYEYMRL